MLCGHGTAGCHGWVEHNPNAAEAVGFHVRPWQNPADIPLKIHGEWYLLLPNGEKSERSGGDEMQAPSEAS